MTWPRLWAAPAEPGLVWGASVPAYPARVPSEAREAQLMVLGAVGCYPFTAPSVRPRTT